VGEIFFGGQRNAPDLLVPDLVIEPTKPDYELVNFFGPS